MLSEHATARASHKQVISHKKSWKITLNFTRHIIVDPLTVENIVFYTYTVTECNLLMDILE